MEKETANTVEKALGRAMERKEKEKERITGTLDRHPQETCARGDTTGGRIGLALLTQILKGCGSTC